MEVSSAEYSASSALPMLTESCYHDIHGLLRGFASMGHSERQVTKIHLSFLQLLSVTAGVQHIRHLKGQ